IDISADIKDNTGVAKVMADNVQLMNVDGNWQGNITAPLSAGKYSLSIKANDAAGNTVDTSVPYNVVRRQGSVNAAILPTVSKIAAGGESTTVAIKVKNTQNIDDTFKVRVSVNGLPAFYRAGTSWFDWTEKTVNLGAKQEVLIPIEVKVPAGTVTGLKTFKASVNSEKFSVHGSGKGYLVIPRPSKNINKQIGPKGLWYSR
ncbi:MAG TPA: Ig-like domain-containing protein, partial [Methanosarcina sp.]|nr:Ig-like domain-containing protein [Methanosarcina sp.]